MAFTGPREAIQDIRDLHETYSDAVTDELVRVDDDWVFSHRHYRVMMTP